MNKLNIVGENIYYVGDVVYEDILGNLEPLSIQRMIALLSQNKIHPRIKLDKNYELIYDDKKNLYVVGITLHSVFSKLLINLFK